MIFIAVKPQYVGIVLKEMKGQLNKESIIVSIAAGVPLAAMKVTSLPQEVLVLVLRAAPENPERGHNYKIAPQIYNQNLSCRKQWEMM